jgi:hypothetical protein
MEMWLSDGESSRGCDGLFIAVKGGSRAGEDNLRRWCEFNVSISARDGR